MKLILILIIGFIAAPPKKPLATDEVISPTEVIQCMHELVDFPYDELNLKFSCARLDNGAIDFSVFNYCEFFEFLKNLLNLNGRLADKLSKIKHVNGIREQYTFICLEMFKLNELLKY